ncbi:ABC transporter permease [Candidatus Dojkabacteria bacterium]|uniref:Transport permease protein n=1 Tax=Candidatus Dojkabacteria bacterium TaxID=2099670 RepID=A0A955RHQ7_9BACT|nr:ABC transporter permease [Candidatus Dojkabacteria bacterium]
MKGTSDTYKKDLGIELIRTSFKLRYNNSVLGFLWVLLNPLLTFLILYIVFSNFSKDQNIENYPIFLLSGLIMYTFFSESLIFGMNSLLDKAGIILKVNFPRELAVISSSSMAVINLAINLIVLTIFAILTNLHATIEGILYFIFCLFVLFILMLGLSFFSSIWLIKLRDLSHISDLVVKLMFYATPIFYSITILPFAVQKLMKFNPLAVIITAGRTGLLYGEIVEVQQVLILLLIGLAVLVAGWFYFNNQVKKIAERF